MRPTPYKQTITAIRFLQTNTLTNLIEYGVKASQLLLLTSTTNYARK